MRTIAGFGEMGWLEESDWTDVAVLSLADELEIYRSVAPELPMGARLLGIDAYGFDVEQGGRRERHQFADGPVLPTNLVEVIQRFLVAL